jgi:hypothetical protein
MLKKLKNATFFPYNEKLKETSEVSGRNTFEHVLLRWKAWQHLENYSIE